MGFAMKKILCLLLCIVLLGSLSLGAFALENPFTDVSAADSRYDAISIAADAGFMVGRGEERFCPNIAICWVEALTAISRADQYLQGHEIEQTEETIWYKPYIKYVSEQGIDLEFPGDVCKLLTRGELAIMLDRIFFWVTFSDTNNVPSDYFADVSEGDEYYDAVYRLAHSGIMCGTEEHIFAPDDFISRADVAVIIGRIAGFAERVVMDLPQPEPELTPPPVSTPAPPPAGEHSELYIEGISVDDVITYFAEVCLDTEFGDKVGGSLIRKWTEPIYYTVSGQPTARDMEVLTDFVGKINAIEGFPGMYPVESFGHLEIYFYDQMNFETLMGNDFVGSWGGVTFWYDGLHQIYSETISIRTDIPQDARDSIICEEIYNGLGPVQDTALRDDSLINQWSNSNYSMTEVDELILKLLYNPAITAGMDNAQCEAVIRQLYY